MLTVRGGGDVCAQESKWNCLRSAPKVTAAMLKPVHSVYFDACCLLVFNVAWGGCPTSCRLCRREQCTFFLTGTWVRQYPNLVSAIHEDGHGWPTTAGPRPPKACRTRGWSGSSATTRRSSGNSPACGQCCLPALRRGGPEDCVSGGEWIHHDHVDSGHHRLAIAVS